MILNPFKPIFETAGAITGTARNLYSLLFLSFIVIPVTLFYGGPEFVSESLNCLMGVFWFLIPPLMAVTALVAISVWRIMASTAFLFLWVPFLLISYAVWMPLIDGVSENKNPFFELVDSKQTSKEHACRYTLESKLLNVSIDKRTVEKELFPGLKWVTVKEQSIR